MSFQLVRRPASLSDALAKVSRDGTAKPPIRRSEEAKDERHCCHEFSRRDADGESGRKALDKAR
jgi:hypothetical protein